MSALQDTPHRYVDSGAGHSDHMITLADGRRLGYRIYGPPDGVPAFYFHGWPGCRLEPGFFNLGKLRLIAPDRPGYGVSDPDLTRTLADWPKDVAALADVLGLEKFALVGLSGGGPYAAACAHALKDRVLACIFIAALGPPEAEGMQQRPVILLREVAKRRVARSILFHFWRKFILNPRNEDRITAIRKRLRHEGKEMEAFDAEFASFLTYSWREALRHSVDGMVSDARIYTSPWPFTLADLDLPVRIWHGEADTIVPSSIGRHYAAHVRGAQAQFVPEEGHVSIVRNHLPAILDDLHGMI